MLLYCTFPCLTDVDFLASYQTAMFPWQSKWILLNSIRLLRHADILPPFNTALAEEIQLQFFKSVRGLVWNTKHKILKFWHAASGFTDHDRLTWLDGFEGQSDNFEFFSAVKFCKVISIACDSMWEFQVCSFSELVNLIRNHVPCKPFSFWCIFWVATTMQTPINHDISSVGV